MSFLEFHLDKAKQLVALRWMAMTLALTMGVASTQAGLLNWLKKAATKSARTEASVHGAASFTKAQVLALAAGLGGGVVHVEAHGGRLLMEVLETGSRLEGQLEDFADIIARGTLSIGERKYVMSNESAAGLGAKLDTLLDVGPVHVMEPALNMTLPVVKQQVGKRHVHFKQLRKNVLVPLDTRIGPEFAQLLGEPLHREKLRVVSMFASSDVDSIQKLAQAAGDAMEDTQRLLKDVRGGTLEAFRGKTLILVGHIEDGAFVLNEASGAAIRIDIETLEQVAKAWDVQLISAGCHSFCAGAKAGFTDFVTDTEMADAVRRSFDAHTMLDLFQAFGQQRPLIVTQEAIDRFVTSRSLHVDELSNGAGAVRVGGLSVQTYSPLMKAEDGTTSVLGGLYMLGVTAFAVMFRSSRSAFLRAFPKLPSPQLAESRQRYILGCLGRELLFVVLGPAFAAFCVFTFFFGGWNHRETITWRLWRFVRHPISETGKLLLASLIVIALLVVYGLVITVIGASIFYLFAFASAQSGSAWYLPAMMLFIVYTALTCWAGWKAHKSLSRRLESTPSLPT